MAALRRQRERPEGLNCKFLNIPSLCVTGSCSERLLVVIGLLEDTFRADSGRESPALRSHTGSLVLTPDKPVNKKREKRTQQKTRPPNKETPKDRVN